jgi:DNA-binding GntR family transcriptional regulator
VKKRDFVVQDLLSKIYQNQFPNNTLPNQRELAKWYGVSRYTIQESVRELKEMGIIDMVQGAGMFIKDATKRNALMYNSLTRVPYERVQSRVIDFWRAPATAEENRIFELDEGAEIWHFKRVRIVESMIEQVEYSRMPVDFFPNLTEPDVGKSIKAYVRSTGHSISHYITSYEPSIIDKELATLMVVKKGTPAMKITNRGILENGRVYIYSEVRAIEYIATYVTPFSEESHRK